MQPRLLILVLSWKAPVVGNLSIVDMRLAKRRCLDVRHHLPRLVGEQGRGAEMIRVYVLHGELVVGEVRRQLCDRFSVDVDMLPDGLARGGIDLRYQVTVQVVLEDRDLGWPSALYVYCADCTGGFLGLKIAVTG